MSKNFGEILKEIRMDLGITGTKMGQILGVTQSCYSKYENDVITSVSADTAIKVIDCLKLMQVDKSKEECDYYIGLLKKIDNINKELNRLKHKTDVPKLKITQNKKEYRLQYIDFNVNINKYSIKNPVALCTIISTYINDTMNFLKKIMAEEKSGNKEIINLYVEYREIREDMMKH